MACLSRLLLALPLVLLAGACSTTPVVRASYAPAAGQDMPLLRLPPAALGRTLALQQQLLLSAGEQTHRLDVMLEVDAEAVRIALLSNGQTAARLVWDGRELSESRATWLPTSVHAARVLSELQLVLWPASAVSAGLPAGWTLQGDEHERVLRNGAEAVVTVRYPAPARAELIHWRDGYRLNIESRALEGAS